MVRLTSRDLRAGLTFLRETYALRDLDAFAHHMIAGLPALVGSDYTSYNEVDVRAGRNRGIVNPPQVEPRLQETFNRHISEHPLIAHYARTRDARAVKISDFLSRDQFHRLGLYCEFFRSLDIEYQMAFALPGPATLVVGIALNRRRPDFSERDRTLLELLRPHVGQAYQNAGAASRTERELRRFEQGLEALDAGIVWLTTEGRRMSVGARQKLREYLGHAAGSRLPEALERWVRHQRGLLARQDDMPPPGRPLVLERDGRRLIVRLLPHGEEALLLLEEEAPPAPAALEALGLTRREAQVLAWLAEGKTNAEIAMILDSRPRTVGKHLERIYQKLGVETRTAAARVALNSVSPPLG